MTGKILIACALVVVASAAAADVVVLKNGNRLEGNVVSEDQESVTIRLGTAELSVSRDDIKEILKQDTPRQLYHTMLEGLDENDPVGHYQIALYCIEEALDDEAVELLGPGAVRIEPHIEVICVLHGAAAAASALELAVHVQPRSLGAGVSADEMMPGIEVGARWLGVSGDDVFD